MSFKFQVSSVQRIPAGEVVWIKLEPTDWGSVGYCLFEVMPCRICHKAPRVRLGVRRHGRLGLGTIRCGCCPGRPGVFNYIRNVRAWKDHPVMIEEAALCVRRLIELWGDHQEMRAEARQRRKEKAEAAAREQVRLMEVMP